VRLGVLDRDLVEALLDRAGRLVGGEDALARRDEGAGGGLELLGVAHGGAPSARWLARLDRGSGPAPRGRSKAGRKRSPRPRAIRNAPRGAAFYSILQPACSMMSGSSLPVSESIGSGASTLDANGEPSLSFQ